MRILLSKQSLLALFTLVGILGAALVAAAGSNVKWLQGWFGSDGVLGAVILGSLLGAMGLVIYPFGLLRKIVSIERETTIALSSTLTPSAELLMDCVKRGVARQEDLYTMMKDLRVYTGTHGTVTDANVYVLNGSGGVNTTLSRCHKSDTGARDQFRRTKGQNASAKEEAAVISRLYKQERIHCKDVNRKSAQKAFSLDPKKARKYKAFISVPIFEPGNTEVPIGMLSVNADRIGVLQNHHLDHLDAVATLLGKMHEVSPLTAFSVHNGGKGRGQVA